jgi:hypothetical protein
MWLASLAVRRKMAGHRQKLNKTMQICTRARTTSVCNSKAKRYSAVNGMRAVRLSTAAVVQINAETETDAPVLPNLGLKYVRTRVANPAKTIANGERVQSCSQKPGIQGSVDRITNAAAIPSITDRAENVTDMLSKGDTCQLIPLPAI